MSKEITIAKEVSPVVGRAMELEIVDGETMKVGVELLSRLNQFNDKIVAEKERVTKPLNEALKAERSRWKPIETQNGEAIDHIREEMSKYQTEQVRKQKEEEAKIAARVGEGKGKLKIETAVRKIEEIEVADKEVATDAGLVQFREKKQLKITDATKIPKIYWTIDEDMLFEALKKGEVVEGAEIEILQVPVNYR